MLNKHNCYGDSEITVNIEYLDVNKCNCCDDSDATVNKFYA